MILTPRFPFGSLGCPLGSAVSRETHRQVSVLAVPWVGCMLPCCYLHNRVRKLDANQSISWLTIHLQEDSILTHSIRRGEWGGSRFCWLVPLPPALSDLLVDEDSEQCDRSSSEQNDFQDRVDFVDVLHVTLHFLETTGTGSQLHVLANGAPCQE